jgi:replicative DNA helicase
MVFESQSGRNGNGKDGSRDFRKGKEAKRPVDILERSPPFDLAAEMGILGSLLLNPDVCNDLTMVIREDDFYDDAHRKLYHHVHEMHTVGQKIDVTLLVSRLKDAGDFEMIGGAAYLAKLANSVPNAAHAVYYANIVRNKSTLRRLIEASTTILRDAYEDAQEPKDLVSQAEARIMQIQDERSANSATVISDVLKNAMARINARMKGEQLQDGVMTHFTDFDNLTGGFHDGELLILAARPGMGKTALAMNIAEQVSMKENAPTLFVSLEMGAIELADRLLCSVARVNSQRLRNGTISQEDRQRLVQNAIQLSNAPLYIDDAPSRTVSEIAAVARRITQQELKKPNGRRLGLMVIDYLQLIEPDNSKDPRQEQVAKIARRLKMMARELKVPVLCLAQLNRQSEEGKDHTPKLSHLRESGAIEQDADVVMFVHRDDYHARGEERDAVRGQAKLIIAKQRNGPIDDVELVWESDFTRFSNKAPEHAADFVDYASVSSPGGY